jgi:hypothetical protein
VLKEEEEEEEKEGTITIVPLLLVVKIESKRKGLDNANDKRNKSRGIPTMEESCSPVANLPC